MHTHDICTSDQKKTPFAVKRAILEDAEKDYPATCIVFVVKKIAHPAADLINRQQVENIKRSILGSAVKVYNKLANLTERLH